MYYVLLDEIQLVPQFEDVLNGFLHIPNVDSYVTGSNARFLSKDIITEFRGRRDEVRLFPLTFREYMSAVDSSADDALEAYMTYGGLPHILSLKSEEQKASYLKNLFAETYLTDIKNRYGIRKDDDLSELLNTLASGIGGLTHPTKLANTFESIKKVKITDDTIHKYLEYICDSFLMERAEQYDIKGERHINSPSKYYFADTGLRNARLNFRQDEKMAQEKMSLLDIGDSFKKIIVVGMPSLVHRDDNGITTMNVRDFLLNENSLEL